jgi:hypothetical protein
MNVNLTEVVNDITGVAGKQVLRYLGRYSHRVAIANSRLLAMEDDQVLFHWRDYADDNRLKVMRLTAEGSAKRPLGVDHPVLAIQTVEPAAKDRRLDQVRHAAAQGELSSLMSLLETGQEFAAKQPAQDLTGNR